MDAVATIEYRVVKRVRLEYGMDGLKVILPRGFTGDVKRILKRHKYWISRRAAQLEKASMQVARLTLEQRTDQMLRIAVMPLLEQSALQLGAVPAAVKYRSMKSRWGSCNSDKVITFSTRLKYLPDRLIAFVVHHEMVHLKVMRHNKEFWEHMQSMFPDTAELRKLLHLYGIALEQK